MDLSVIIPCHNLEPFIGKLLHSLEVQEIQNKEVEYIFVLDDCTDNTKQIINDACDRIKIPIAIKEACVHSCGLARNIGLEASSGKYIWFIDGDDWLLTSHDIEGLVEVMELMDEPAIRFRYKHTPNFMLDFCEAMIWQYCFKREAIGNMRFRREQPHEDRNFILNFVEQYGRPVFVDRFFYFYNYMRPGSNMQQFITTGEILM